MAAFSQYIVYADESGSPVLGADAGDFPVFVLNFLVVEKRFYAEKLVPRVTSLKFATFGHDQVILHERDIRRQSGAFTVFRKDRTQGSQFLDALNALFASKDGQFMCTIIDKVKLAASETNRWSPYDIALGLCMERTAAYLLRQGDEGNEVHVIFEARGKKEDQHLELEFRRIADGNAKVSFGSMDATRLRWTPMFIDKKSNSVGLQLADLAARPMGLSYLRPSQPNRAFSALRTGFAEGGFHSFP